MPTLQRERRALCHKYAREQQNRQTASSNKERELSLQIDATEAKSLIDIPTGSYPATVSKVEAADGQYGDQVKFYFDVLGQRTTDGEPLELWAWASQKLNPRTKLWRWTKVLTGQEPVKGNAYDLESLVGASCSLLVVRTEETEGVRCRVQDIGPGRKAASAPAPDTCSQCSEPVAFYTPAGVALCEAHAPKAVA